jgi:plastocyanin
MNRSTILLHRLMSVAVATLGVSLIATMPTVAAAAPDTTVTIHDDGALSTWGYTETMTAVQVGQTVVTWTNLGAKAHAASAVDGSWHTALLENGASGSVTFSMPGTYAYICAPHPWMQGTIVVLADAGSAPATDDATSSGTGEHGT